MQTTRAQQPVAKVIGRPPEREDTIGGLPAQKRNLEIAKSGPETGESRFLAFAP